MEQQYHAQRELPDFSGRNNSCLECGEPLKGRSDKKFCDTYCRNNFHNRVNADQHREVRSINSRLLRNRRILLDLVGRRERLETDREKLRDAGYDPNYHTRTTWNTKEPILYCYEFELVWKSSKVTIRKGKL